MTFSPHRRSLGAALAALLMGACTPSSPSTGPSPVPRGEPETQLEPAAWTTQSPANEIATWARQGCRRAPGGKDACIERTLVSLIDQAGISKSMEVLDTLANVDDGVKANAHALAHGLGIAAYRGTETLAATFAGCPVSQMSGCYHGVIQGYFLELNAQGKDIGTAEMDALCDPHRAVLFVYFQCAHGMGHGLMAVHENHVPMALEGCDRASEEFIRESCYGGVFMENIVNVTHPHHTAGGHAGTQGHGDHGAQPAAADEHAGHGQQASAADEHAGHVQATPAPDAHAGHAQPSPAADPHAGHGQQAAADAHAGHDAAPADDHAGHAAASAQPAMQHGEWRALDRNDWLYPCNAVAEKYQDACYGMQTSAVMFFNYGDVGSTARVCERAPERFLATCFMSLGRDITAFAAQEHRRTINMCERAGDTAAGRGQVWCLLGAVQTLVNQSADPADGIRFCRAVAGAEAKRECYAAVGEMTAALLPDVGARGRSCATAESDFVVACRRGAGIEPQSTGSDE